MPYILQGTKGLLDYWNRLGRPCDLDAISAATGIPKVNFMGVGRDKESFTATYGEEDAQALASVMGTTVANISASGDQVLI